MSGNLIATLLVLALCSSAAVAGVLMAGEPSDTNVVTQEPPKVEVQVETQPSVETESTETETKEDEEKTDEEDPTAAWSRSPSVRWSALPLQVSS